MAETLKLPLYASIRLYNAMRRKLLPVSRPISTSVALQAIEQRSVRNPTDISDFLGTIYSEALAANPRLIVELGVRTGESRSVLEQVAGQSGAVLVSVDLDDCSTACRPSAMWHFIQSDDIKFAQEFQQWCTKRNINSQIDVLFIDSSHLYEHTVAEIRSWFPLLSSKCKVILHDTNLKTFYRRTDGTVGRGWDNARGVIRALEESLNTKFNEKVDFVTTVDQWIIRHWAHCNGLTIMERANK